MKPALIAATILAGLWGFALGIAHFTNFLDGIAYQMPNAPRGKR